MSLARVEVTGETFLACMSHALSNDKEEIMGLLFGADWPQCIREMWTGRTQELWFMMWHCEKHPASPLSLCLLRIVQAKKKRISARRGG